MKKYLYNKIEIKERLSSEDEFRFYTCRELTFCEWFSASVITEQGNRITVPQSLKQFLSYLEKTELNENYNYDIYVSSWHLHVPDKKITFDELLKSFAKSSHISDRETLIKFYKRAHEIKQEATEYKKLFEQNSEDVAKQG